MFFIAYTVGYIIHCYGDFQLLRAKSLHPIIRLLTISIFLEWLSIIMFMSHYAIYSGNGVGSPFLNGTAQFIDMMSSLVFMLLLILIAKGWGITFPTLSHIQSQRKILLGILIAFFILYVILFFWGLFGMNPASDLYVYQSVPGIIFLIVRFFTFVYFVWCLLQTYKQEMSNETDTSKKRFYVSFGISYAIWFLILPILVLTALAYPVVDRFKVVVILNVTTTAIALALLCFLLWPSRARQYFTVAVPNILSGVAYERL